MEEDAHAIDPYVHDLRHQLTRVEAEPAPGDPQQPRWVVGRPSNPALDPADPVVYPTLVTLPAQTVADLVACLRAAAGLPGDASGGGWPLAQLAARLREDYRKMQDLRAATREYLDFHTWSMTAPVEEMTSQFTARREAIIQRLREALGED